MRSAYALILLPLLYACSSAPISNANLPAPTVAHSLSIARHHTVAIDDVQVDQILRSMHVVLAQQESVNDTVCNIKFIRTGSIQSFNMGTGIINNADDFAHVTLNVPGNVKVVNMINYCGRFGTFLGCAPRPGNSLVVVRTSNHLEGTLWAHEFGHNQGLRHKNSSKSLMSPTVSQQAKQVDQTECTALEQP